MTGKSYYVENDAYFSGISVSDWEPDGISHFKTFSEAKASLLEILRMERDNFKEGIINIVNLRKSEVDGGTHHDQAPQMPLPHLPAPE